MNLNEFLEELSKTRNGWHMGIRRIRKVTRNNRHCPITAVCVRVKKTRFAPSEVEKAGARLGLDGDLIEDIVAAADGNEGRLRSRLLKAVGLK